MTMDTTITQTPSFKIEKDLTLVNILSALLIVIIFFFPNSPARIIFGLLVILFFPGYVLICALFPRKEDLDGIERLALSIGLSIAVTCLIGLALNYTPFGIRVYPVTFSMFLFMLLMSAVAMYRRKIISPGDVFDPLASITMSKIYNFEWVNREFMEFSNENIIVKIIAIIAFIFLTLSAIIIKSSPATGYELSIYSSISPLVWIFLIVSSIGGVSIIVHQVFTKSKSKFWLIGFSILVLSNFIILSLHALRGYLHYCSWDHIAHLRMVKSLIETGHLGSFNFYPIIHIFCSQIAEICDIEPNIVAQYVPAFLSVLFLMLPMYLLAKSSVLEEGQVLLACAASGILFFNSLHVQVYPHVFSVLLFPLILYLYFKSLEKNTWQFNLLFIILLILLPYTHPSGSLAFIFLLIAMELARVAHDKRHEPEGTLSKIAVNPILISSITFFMWLSSFRMFGAKLSSLHSSIFEPYKNPHFLTLMETTARLEWIEVIEYNLKMYGDYLIYIALALIAGIIIIKRIFKKEKRTKYLFLLFMFFLICIPIEYILFIGVGSETAGRVLNLLYMMTVAPVLVGFVLYELFKNKKRAFAITVVVIILALTYGISIFSVYHSPWTFSPSWHITNMDVKGSEWFLGHRNSTYEFDAMGIDLSLMKGEIGLIPEHFNYSQHTMLGESLSQDSYAVINKRCKLANADPMVQKARLNMLSGWGFNESDFYKFENHDQSVSKLYSNGEFWVYLVESGKGVKT